jgi:hypothetical protein
MQVKKKVFGTGRNGSGTAVLAKMLDNSQHLTCITPNS